MDASIQPCQNIPNTFIVSTCDFFYPNVEDPYIQGRIAAANVLSDMYAMGVENIDSVLMTLAASTEMSPDMRHTCTKLMMKGFDDTCRDAGTKVSGGQTVLNPWPIIGGVAMSVLPSSSFILPVNAIPGDIIVLTKPLGTQIAVNCKQWTRIPEKWAKYSKVIDEQEVNRAFSIAQDQMTRLNRNAAILMKKYGAHAATDVTGFGILGHLDNLCGNQKREVSMIIHTLPIIRTMKKVNEEGWNFKLLVGYSAETSGGLMICLPSLKAAQDFCSELQERDGKPAWIIGDVIEGPRLAKIADDVKIIEV